MSFRSALAQGVVESVSILLIGIVLGSLGVVGGPMGEVLDVPARVRDGSCWFGPRGSETYQLQHDLGIGGGLMEGWTSIEARRSRSDEAVKT
jgi:hypothetical protein